MSESGYDPKADPIVNDPDVADHTGADTGIDPAGLPVPEDLSSAEPSEEAILAAAAEADEPRGIAEELADRDASQYLSAVEPGAEGPPGTGTEGADDVLVDSTDDAGYIRDASGGGSDYAEDLQSAAEQGNRAGDEMASTNLDDDEVADLDGDELSVDALADDGTERVETVDGLRTVDGEPGER